MAQLSFKIQAEWDKVQRLREEIAKLKQEIGKTDAIQNPTAFNKLNSKLQQTGKELSSVTGKIAQASATMETDFRRKIYAASQTVNGFTEKIIAQKAVVKDVAADVRKLGDAYREAKKYSPMSADGKFAEWKAAKRALEEEKATLFGLTQEQANARLSVKKLRDEYASLKQEGGGTAETMNLLTAKMKQMGAAVFGGIGLKELASRIISVRAEFESMETSLKVLLGGSQEKLNNIMGQIKEYALASPLNTKDMVGAVQMMTSFGIEAEKSIDFLKAIGDISMGDTGKFNSLALAFSQMSSAGKLMGQDLMQMVNAGFNPLEEIARKTGKSIGELKEEMSKGAISSKMVQDAFISATSAGGKFFGMSQEGAKTLRGQISMLQESFDMMFNEIGAKGEGVIMGAVKTGTSLVENYERTGRVLLGLVTTYGTYRTAVAIATLMQNRHALAVTLARKAQALLNATMLANPYVLAATALGALVGVMIAQKTQTDLVNDATKRYNEEKEKIIEREKKHNEEILKLCEVAGDESLSTENRRLALVKLEQKYPSIFKKYDTEAEKLAHILEFKQKIAELDGKTSITNPRNELSQINKRLEELDKLSKMPRAQSIYTPGAGGGTIQIAALTQKEKAEQTALLKRRNALTKQINKDASDNYLANLTGVSNAELNGQINQRKNLLAQMSITEKKYGKVTYGGAKGTFTREELEGQIGILQAEKTRRKKRDVVTKKDLQDRKRTLQAELDGLSEIEAKGKKGSELKRKIAALTKRENDAYSTSISGKSDNANKVTSNQIDYDKLAREQSDAEKELADKSSQAYIDSLQNGYEKEKKQRELNHKKELDDLEKYKRDFLQKKISDAKQIFEADPKNKGKKFNASSVTLTQDEQDKFDKMRSDTLKKHANEDKEYQREQTESLNGYLKEYGTFEEKKLAITQEYEDRIRKASSVGEKAILEMQRDKEIEKIKNDDLQSSIDWNGVFSDLQGHTKQYLQGLRNQLQDLLNTGDLPIDQMQVISDKTNTIDDELGKQQGIWDFTGERTREHNRLLKEAADAQERLNIARSEEVKANLDVFSAQSNVQKELASKGINLDIKDISTASLNGKIDLADEKFKDMAPLLQKLAVAEGKLTGARKKTANATNKAKQAEDAAKRKKAQAVSDWFSGVQDFIAEKGIDQIPDLLDSVGLGKAGDKIAKGLDGVNSAAGAAADFASGNYIGAAFKGISAIKSFGSALGIGGGNEKQVAETTERLTKSNETLADRIDDLSEVIGNSAGAKAVNAYETALKAQEEINKNQMEILKAQMGYHGSHRSNAKYADDRKIASYNRDAQLAFKAAGVDMSTISGLKSIYNLTPEQLKAIKDFAPDLWNYITTVGKYDKSKYWDDVVEQAGKTAKLTGQIQNNLTQTSFSSLRDSFLDTLMDMDSDASDFSKAFEDMLFKSLINTSVLNDEFDSWLKQFQEKWANKIKSGTMSKTDWNSYAKEWNAKRDELVIRRDNIAKNVGYTGKTIDQKATTNGLSQISYEQATNLIALTTAGNISRDQIKDILLSQKLSSIDLSLTGISLIGKDTVSIADETRTILANSYMELKEINENTGVSAKCLTQIDENINSMNRLIKDKL